MGNNAGMMDFERHRPRLVSLARRMLGDGGEAEEVVQEAWLRLSRNRPDNLRSMGAWLTTIVTRLCLDELRGRRRRGHTGQPLVGAASEIAADEAGTPERQLLLADTIGVAMLVVLERLNPAERVAFVLHDVFDMPFDEIAPLIERSSVATRQLASRARRRIRATGGMVAADLSRHARLAESFLAAARSGDIAALLHVLAPEVTLRPDATAARLGPGGDIAGADEVAAFFVKQGAGAAHVALVDGAVGLIIAPMGRLLLAIQLGFEEETISSFRAIADPEALQSLDLGLAPVA